MAGSYRHCVTKSGRLRAPGSQQVPTCTIDNGHSGVEGVPYCGPGCEDTAPGPLAGCCQKCGRPEADGVICAKCCREAAADLTELLIMMPELETTIGRRDRVDNPPRRRKRRHGEDDGWHKGSSALGAHPLPVNTDASRERDKIVGEAATWARHLVETRRADGEAV